MKRLALALIFVLLCVGIASAGTATISGNTTSSGSIVAYNTTGGTTFNDLLNGGNAKTNYAGFFSCDVHLYSNASSNKYDQLSRCNIGYDTYSLPGNISITDATPTLYISNVLGYPNWNITGFGQTNAGADPTSWAGYQKTRLANDWNVQYGSSPHVSDNVAGYIFYNLNPTGIAHITPGGSAHFANLLSWDIDSGAPTWYASYFESVAVNVGSSWMTLHYITTPNTDFSATPTSGQPGLLVSFTDLTTYGSGTGRTCSWNFGDTLSPLNNSSVCGNVQHVYQYGGVYDVNYTVKDTNGVSTTIKSQYIVVSTNQNAQNTWWTPHNVQVTVMDTYGTRLQGVSLSAVYNQSSMPVSWLNQLYGIQTGPGGDMVNKSLYLTGTTGSDGSITYTMLGTLGYDISLNAAQYGISNYNVSTYPSDSMLNIYVPLASKAIPGTVNSTVAEINSTRLYVTQPDTMNLSLCIDYKDDGGRTNFVNMSWWYKNNNTAFNWTNITNPGTSLVTVCNTVFNTKGQQFAWQLNASRNT